MSFPGSALLTIVDVAFTPVPVSSGEALTATPAGATVAPGKERGIHRKRLR
jgi:hypothetical protein